MATKQATKYKEQGNAAFKAGNHAKAIEYYTYATELDPKNPVFFTNRSTAYFKMKKFDKSLRDANKAIKVDSKWAKGYYRKGLVLLEEKKLKEAITELETASKMKPKNQTFSATLAKAKAALHSTMSAAEYQKSQANTMYKTGKIDDAIKAYTTAISLCQDTPKENLLKADIYANRALCYRQLYDSKAVVSDATSALKLNPNHVKAMIRRGQAYESLEKFDLALNDFQQATYLAPGTSVAVQGAARIRASKSREAKAKDKKSTGRKR